MIAVVLRRLRPHPHRGDVIAAGAVPLALLALIVPLRMLQWPLGARFGVVAVIALLLLTMGWLAELEADTPRAYHSILLIGGVLSLAVALLLLAELLGARRPPGAGGLAWVFAAAGTVAALCARRANSSACTLIAALSLAVAAEAFVARAFAPHGTGTFRAVLVALTVLCGGGVVRFRDRRRRHAVALMNAAALLTVVLGATLLALPGVAALLTGGLGGAVRHASGFGWELWILAVGFGLIAYAGADREPGPAYFGVVLLVEFAALVALPWGNRGSFVGWPLFLLVIGGSALAIGMRPLRPLPPPPGAEPVAPTIPLTREDHD